MKSMLLLDVMSADRSNICLSSTNFKPARQDVAVTDRSATSFALNACTNRLMKHKLFQTFEGSTSCIVPGKLPTRRMEFPAFTAPIAEMDPEGTKLTSLADVNADDLTHGCDACL